MNAIQIRNMMLNIKEWMYGNDVELLPQASAEAKRKLKGGCFYGNIVNRYNVPKNRKEDTICPKKQ